MDTPSPYQAQERYPVTPQSRHTVLRSYPSQPELENAHRQMDRSWTHIRPNSVLVATMGNHWRQGGWNKVIDMIEHTQSQGVYCALSEIQDRCFNPYDALGTMRNEAILTALGEGFQFLCYLDNDVKPEKDYLLKLLQWQMPLVAPYVVEPGTGNKLFGPGNIQISTGLQRAKWSVLSMLLINTSIFRLTGPEFWRDAVGADEGYHFTKFNYYGYHLYIDTAVQLEVGGRPLYPLAMNRVSSGSMADVANAAKIFAGALAGVLERRGLVLPDPDRLEISNALAEFIRIAKGDREITLQQKIERFVEPPDRRPIDPNSPWVKDGEYAPFLVKMEQAKKQEEAQKSSASMETAAISLNGENPTAVAKALAFSGVGNG